MRKFNLVVAALATFAVASPTLASAQGVVIGAGGDRVGVGINAGGHRDRGEFRGARAEFHGHRGWHRHHDKVIVIKRGHRHHH